MTEAATKIKNKKVMINTRDYRQLIIENEP